MNNFNMVNNNQQRSPYSSYLSPTTPTNNIIWVQGIEGAKAWQLPPSSMAILLDSEVEGKMYIKVTDNIGMGSLRVFNYVEEITQPTQVGNVTSNNIDLSQYVKKDELQNLIKELFTNEYTVPTVNSTTTDTESGKPKIITVKK